MSQVLRRLLGPVTLALLALTFWFGLWVTPPDQIQGNLVRLVYLHPPIAWVALYLAFGLSALASPLYLWGPARPRGAGPPVRGGGAGRVRRRAHRALLGDLVADPPPGGDRAQRQPLAH